MLIEAKERNNKSILDSNQIKSFDPIIGLKATVLILGTIPGKDSLRQDKYYGHARNSFWKIMYQLFDGEFEMDYERRKEFLKKNKIALWDVCQSANQRTSLDVDIKNEQPNAITALIESNLSLKTIAFNGQKAEKLYFNYHPKIENITYLTLLSTSPANASYSFEQKLANWSRICQQ